MTNRTKLCKTKGNSNSKNVQNGNSLLHVCEKGKNEGGTNKDKMSWRKPKDRASERRKSKVTRID